METITSPRCVPRINTHGVKYAAEGNLVTLTQQEYLSLLDQIEYLEDCLFARQAAVKKRDEQSASFEQFIADENKRRGLNV